MKTKKPKNKQPKKPPLLKDKEAMKEIIADPKQIQYFFENCIKKAQKKTNEK
jgi:hypothetical protein